MNIVILDRCTVTRGDVSLEPLERLGDVRSFDLLPPEGVAAAIGDAEAVIVNKARITADVMDACPNLKFVGLFATGYNNIDVKAADERGIVVCNVPGYSTASVAQHTIALMLHFASHADDYAASVANGDWVQSKTFSYFKYPVTELCGKTLGLYGYGTIARAVAAIALAFGMKVIATSRRHTSGCEGEVRFVDGDTLFAQSDYISLHCPLTDETHHIIDEAALEKCKRGVVLLNTSRGALVDAEALLNGIKSRKVGAACLDVYEEESDLFFEDNSGHIMEDDTLARLISMPNVIVTSHQAFLTEEALMNIAETTVQNLKDFFETNRCENELCWRGGTTETCRDGKCF